MGVPKFFRWISERYPTISQLIAENRIPEFDNLYLDMNGIIHNCTHSDSDTPDKRVPEEEMFIAIFNYIEHLFGKIKPKKLFFMAIDGVAPRAKMNQQRARRFRTALDAEKAREKAIKEGMEMPKEPAFDTNSITPGTPFMARLTEQLKYFINKKVSQDADWQGVEIVLSGHEVPGEGEHKIMEYIRLAKAQPDYDPNVRHCLYGLDADLIMLGLLSHDPHFCLLREEVTFGRQSKAKSKELEHQNFFLMHLSVVREYLEYEFQDLKEPGVLSFPFDMERIIDDFILLAFFVGNDFLPNLPNLHINEGALALQFRTYKKVLPKAKGYLNEHGVINLERLKLLLDELGEVEQRFFESEVSDASYLKGKQESAIEELEKAKKKGKRILTSDQMSIVKKVKAWLKANKRESTGQPLDLPAELPARDRAVVEELADSLKLNCQRVADEKGDFHLQLSLFPTPEGEEENSEDEEESRVAVDRILRSWERATVSDIPPQEAEEQLKKRYDEKFIKWRDDYYKSKFGWGLDNEEELRKLTENYVEGLQWVLYYYYRGVVSWPWYYRYHYSPRISDISKGLGANLDFKLGQPFRPFEQLMGVLPDRSKEIVPKPYHDLMTNPNSPIIDFYPREFELDMNGKKMDWEAVVKIPFIEEDRLLAAMRTKEHLLSKDEKKRNQFGVSLKFTYSPEVDMVYEAPAPPPDRPEARFPNLEHCHCVENIYELPTLDGLDIIVGLCEGVKLGVNALAGFPSLKTLPHTAALGYHGVNVFQQDSRNESMVITLGNAYKDRSVEEAKKLIGKRVFVGYPFLQEAKVSAVSDEMFTYKPVESGMIIPAPHNPYELTNWKRKADRMENHYSKRMGIVTGPVEVIIHVDMLKGMLRTDEGAMIKDYAHIPGVDTEYAFQTIVNDVVSEDQRFIEKAPLPIEEEFPEGSRAFFLGEFNYGRPLEVLKHNNNRVDIWLGTMPPETMKCRQLVADAEKNTVYRPSYVVARQLGLNPLVLSKITSSFSVLVDGARQNLGLNLKFEAKKLKVLGYSRRSDNGWEFSDKAVKLIQEYMTKFPDFFKGIMRNPQGDLYNDTDFFDPSESKAKIKEIQAWLKSIESKSFEKVPLEAQQLPGNVVKAIEEAMDEAKAKFAPSDIKPRLVKNVPRNALLRPEDAEHRLHNQRFLLGDRVVYVSGSGKVPLATLGTVVGLTRTARITLVDVVFDDSFMSGTTLSQRCSPFRGMTVPEHTILNLTQRQFIAQTRASAPTARGPQQPQFRTAPAPPPLNNTFANSVAGRGRGGARGGAPPARGAHRGGPVNTAGAPRGGFVPRGPVVMAHRGPPPQIAQRGGAAPVPVIAQRGGAAPVPVQPGQYQAVPPPPVLNQRGGRGGRGRGGRGRGGARGGRGGAGAVQQEQAHA